jgi:hypothetical protein
MHSFCIHSVNSRGSAKEKEWERLEVRREAKQEPTRQTKLTSSMVDHEELVLDLSNMFAPTHRKNGRTNTA